MIFLISKQMCYLVVIQLLLVYYQVNFLYSNRMGIAVILKFLVAFQYLRERFSSLFFNVPNIRPV